MNPNLRNLQALQGGRTPQGPEQREMELRQARLQSNPLASDKNMIPTLRGLCSCPIGQEQKQVSALVAKMIETHNDQHMDLISGCVAETLKAEFECHRNVEERTVARLEEDELLLALLNKMRDADKKVLYLQAELESQVKEMQNISSGLWQMIIKSYGLIPDQRSYCVDEDTGVVKQVSIDCEKCNAKKVLPELRRKLAQALMDMVEAEKKDA